MLSTGLQVMLVHIASLTRVLFCFWIISSFRLKDKEIGSSAHGPYIVVPDRALNKILDRDKPMTHVADNGPSPNHAWTELAHVPARPCPPLLVTFAIWAGCWYEFSIVGRTFFGASVLMVLDILQIKHILLFHILPFLFT